MTGPVSRRSFAKGMAWTAPTIVVGAAAPTLASSAPDVVVGKTECSKAGGSINNIPFTVTTVNGAVIPAGSVFTVNYAGGSSRPTWSGLLASNSSVVITPSNDTSGNGGRYGSIKFTLRSPMPKNTVWDLTIGMDIGAFITRQSTSLSLTSVDSKQNYMTTNDVASHSMYFGGCGD